MQIETQKVDFKDKAKPRIDAKTDHKPGGGDKKVGPLSALFYLESKIIYFVHDTSPV